MYLVLLKGSIEEEEEEEKDRYSEVLKPICKEYIRQPVLKFEYLNKSKEIAELEFDCVLATSIRAIQALHLFINEDLKTKMQNLPWFVVGKGSENAAKTLLQVKTIYGSNTGSAENLLSCLDFISCVKEKKRILYLCGNLRRSLVSETLIKEQVYFIELILYKTIPDPDVVVPFQLKVPRVCVFFSPSGLFFTKTQLLLETDYIIAIGKTTYQALVNENIKVHNVASSPTPEGLKQAILDLKII